MRRESNRVAIRTDYNFPSVETAAAVTGFFFGEDFAAQVRRQGWTRVPAAHGALVGGTLTAVVIQQQRCRCGGKRPASAPVRPEARS